MTVVIEIPSCRCRGWKVSAVTRIGCVSDEILVTVDGFGAAMWEKCTQSQGVDPGVRAQQGIPRGWVGGPRTVIIHAQTEGGREIKRETQKRQETRESGRAREVERARARLR